jgi:hypothetical protein
LDLPNDFRGEVTKHRGVKLFIGIDDIDQVMADAGAIGYRRLPRANVQVAVNLLRIAVDYFPADPGAQLKSEFALAHCRGAENNDDFGFHRTQSVLFKVQGSTSKVDSRNPGSATLNVEH